MTAQQHLETTLRAFKEPPLGALPQGSAVEDAILAKVLSKKFRKLRADEDAISITKQAIHTSVLTHAPIRINCIFGGNKLWHFEEAPEIDWAELFAATYMARWLASIASIYAPGAYLEFYSEDVVLEAMNNLPPDETDRYSQSFQAMLHWLRQYLPPNVALEYKRYGDAYPDRGAFLSELEAAKAKVLQENGGVLPVLTDAQKAAVEMNVRLKPGQADDPQWREKVELIHQSIERTATMERYISNATMIPASPTNFPGCIVTGSTKKSYAKFWVGVGALEPSGDGFNELVLTPKQLAEAHCEWSDVHLPGLEAKNFSRIRVLT